MAALALDLRMAFRALVHGRAATFLAVACLAMGVGTSAAMLDLLDLLLFRPPVHVEEAGQLRRAYFTNTYPGSGESTSSITSFPAFLDLKAVRSFSEIGAYAATDVSLGRGEEARKARAVLATPSFLRLLGVTPVRGRLFADSEGEPGRPGLVALISQDLWQRGFAGSAEILGEQLIVGRDLYTVIGVLPRGFTGIDLERIDVWLPMNAAALLGGSNWATSRDSSFLSIAGRLRGGTSDAASAAEATTVARAASAEAGRPAPALRVSLGPVQQARGPEAPSTVRVAVWLTGLSWIVLLVSCANVASLLLVRALDRRRELALRRALGASAGRLARMMLFESGAVAAAAGVAAVVVFLAMSALLQRLILPQAGLEPPGLSPRTAALLLGLALASAMLSGLTPALWASRVRLFEEIRRGAREAPRSRLNAAVAAAQIALTLVLLAGAGAFSRSLHHVLHLDLGLDADRVLVATVDLAGAGYLPSRVDESFRLAAERIRRLSKVEGTCVAVGIPFRSSFGTSIAVPGVDRLPAYSANFNAVSEEFFQTLGTSVLRGQAFTAADRAGSLPVVIVNQTMARLLWPGQDALGKCLQIRDEEAPCSTVVGVVEDARQMRLQEEPTMQFYVPLGQAPEWLTSRVLFVRAGDDPDSLAGMVRREFQAVAPNLPYVEVRTLESLLARQIQPWRMGAEVLTLFGLLGLGLALAGLYGVVAHGMARRTYELGVRMALGARRRELVWLPLRQGLGIGLAGMAAGILLTLAAARFVQPLLFQVSARDPWTLGAAAGVVLLMALLASYASGRRVRRLDPIMALRVE